MPKRVIDFDAMWASDKLAACAEWAQVEYAWLYGLADASGSFEMTNLRVIWGKVAAIRANFTIEHLEATFNEFIARGLLFTWCENGKRYGHWTGSDVPGRLPPPSWRARLERLAPPVPQTELAAYLAQFGGSRSKTENGRGATTQPSPLPASAVANSSGGEPERGELKHELEAPQTQEWDLDLNREREETQACASPTNMQSSMHASDERDAPSENSPEGLLRIFAEERGALPAAEPLTPALRRQCALRLAAGLSPGDFRIAVRRAAVTPFLSGGGERGWRATFDWFMANDTNVGKVLDGRYDPNPAKIASPLRETRNGTAPVAGEFGARVSAAAFERILAREKMRGPGRGHGDDPSGISAGCTIATPQALHHAASRKGVA